MLKKHRKLDDCNAWIAEVDKMKRKTHHKPLCKRDDCNELIGQIPYFANEWPHT